MILMLRKLKKKWREFQHGTPGHRFKERYARNNRPPHQKSAFQKAILCAVGLFMTVAGVVLLFIPGPGIPLIIIGCGILADQFENVARVLDLTEVMIRKATGRVRKSGSVVRLL
jgi:hypothetical protein